MECTPLPLDQQKSLRESFNCPVGKGKISLNWHSFFFFFPFLQLNLQVAKEMKRLLQLFSQSHQSNFSWKEMFVSRGHLPSPIET